MPFAVACADPEGAGGLEPTPGESQAAICFLRNTGTDPIEKQFDLLLLEGGQYSPL